MPAPVPMPVPVFDCKGTGGRYLLRAADNGSLALEISGSGKRTLTSWREIRTGRVVGQQGGHQSHVRLFDGKRSLILYEGRNGALADPPGIAYAGVVEVGEGGPGDERTVARCAASARNHALLDTIHRQREAAGLDPLPEEIAHGPYDAWF